MKKNRVLFVDDDKSILSGFRRNFRHHFEVHTAEGAKEALAKMEDRTFPVVVSDLKMVGMDGISFLGKVKALYPNSIRVLLTGHANINHAISAVNEGEIFRFLQKPCDVQTLKKVLDDSLRQHQLIVAERHLAQTHQQLADAYIDVKLLSEQQAQLIATTTHDLRSPLTSILGFVKLVANDIEKLALKNDSKVNRISENLSIICEESERMLRLTNELLEGASTGTHSSEWASENINLCDLIDKAKKVVGGKLSKKQRIELKFVKPDTCPNFLACPDKLMQVLVNLLDNAIKFTTEGQISIVLLADDEDILISVEDSGRGIEAERLDHIFDSYHTTDTTNKVSGLGLPICKQIIEHYKGTIEVVSEFGSGTVFRIYLPA